MSDVRYQMSDVWYALRAKGSIAENAGPPSADDAENAEKYIKIRFSSAPSALYAEGRPEFSAILQNIISL